MREHIYTPEIVGVEFEDVYAKATDGTRLHGWRLQARTPRKGTVIFFHGNAENISTHFANVYWLVDHGYEVYAFDYRGYGLSEGYANLDLIMSDFDPVIAKVLAGIDRSENVIVFGHSFGASMVLYAAAKSEYRSRFKAIISLSAFSDFQSVAQDMLSRSWLTWLLQWPLSFTIDNRYRADDIVDQLSPVPLLLMHSRNDEVVEFDHAETLFRQAVKPKQFIEVTGDHNHTFNLEENRQLLIAYLNRLNSL